jgi:Domain of unknown function (DUF4190)/GYF domain 2
MTEQAPITYRVRGDREYGPVDFAVLERWTHEARVTRNTAIWSSSDGQWRAAGERRELDAAFAAWVAADAPPVTGPPVNAQAIWSFVLAQFGLCCCLPAIPAIICGFISLGQIRRRHDRGRALAVSGIILGFCGLVLGALFVVYSVLIASLDDATKQQILDGYLKQLQGMQPK